MAIPTRKQWTRDRDAAGGSAGLVKGVSIGDLLDDYHKAGGKLMGAALMLATTKPVTELGKGLKAYRAKVPANKPQLAKLVDGMLAAVAGQVKDGEALSSPVNNVVAHTKAAVTESAAAVQSGDRVAYDKMWRAHLRGAGTGWASLIKLDPGLKPLYEKLWKPLTLDPWSANGAKVGNGSTDAAEITKRVKAAATVVNQASTRMMTELRNRNVTS